MNRTLLGITGGVVLGAAGLLVADHVWEAPQWTASEESFRRFPNVVLQTHDGETVNFYDDLLEGKIVALNFMYASCKGF